MKTIQQFQQLFQQYLEAHTFGNHPRELYDPVNYILSLGGKRLRPVLALFGCYLFGEQEEKALPAAMAVEVFHNFSLVHDDIMDQAPLRRGQPTVHSRFGLNAGILSGDVMLIYAYDYLTRVDDPGKINSLIGIFNKVAIKVCEGQQYDMNFENTGDVSIAEYLHMINGKTAALISGSLELGAVIGGASMADQANLAAFGEHIGMAFQLQDDYLDTFGDAAKVGKKPGGDIVQNKKTYLILKAMELADAETRHRLHFLMNSPTRNEAEKVAEVTQLLEQLQVPAFAREIMETYQQRAFQHLDQVNALPERKILLRRLAEDLIAREY